MRQSSSQDALERCRRLEERLRVLSEAMRAFAESTGEPARLLDTIAQRVAEVVKDYCVVMLLPKGGTTLTVAAMFDADPDTLRLLREWFSVPFLLGSHSVGRRVQETGEPFFAPKLDPGASHPGTDPRTLEFLQRIGVHSMLIVPLRVRDRPIGQIVLARHRPESASFDRQDLELAQSLADHAALAVYNARLLTEARADFAERSRSYAAERLAVDAAGHATAALRLATSRFARLSEAGIIGILVYSQRDSRPVVINRTLLDLLGYAEEEILSGQVAWATLTPPEWREEDARASAQLEASGVATLREKEYLHKNGTRVPVLIGAAVLAGDSQECICFLLDLTERKKAEAAVAKLREERAVDEKARRLAAIVDSSDEAIIGKTLDGVITSWNQGASHIFGYSAEEIVGKSIAVLVPPERAAEEPTILEMIAKGVVQRFDTVRQRKDGQEIDVAVTVSPVRDESGRIVSVSKVARDITDRKRNEVALAHARDAAEAASRELEAFSYSVAHDLRAPLRGMNGFAQVLLETYGDKFDAEGRDWLEEIRLNANRMGSLIDALLSLSRVTRSEMKRESVDLSALVRATGRELSAAEPGRAVEIVVQDQLRAELDPNLARALVQNLVGNAWKFTRDAPAARVDFGATTVDGGREFFVRDNGAGFDMTFASKLFAPFQRLHTTEEFPGTGIGLATVQRIVHRHGGRVWAEGAVGAGATFHFSFSAEQVMTR